MKKILILLLITSLEKIYSQNMQIQNMVNYMRNKDYEKAKAAADAAAVHESTKTSPKMWLNRGNVYRAIFIDTTEKVRSLDNQAEEKALDAYINCLTYDKDGIYKSEMRDYFLQSASAVNKKADFFSSNKQAEEAVKCYDLVEKALPYDAAQNLKARGITKEKLMFSKFEAYKKAGDKEKTKSFANTLAENKYADPRLYLDMVRISLEDKDTSSALSYIEKGKAIYQDNMGLIGTEIDIYLARKKTDVLKDKLIAAIAIAPTNEVLHLVLANLYKKLGAFEDAEKAYIKTLEVKPGYEPANYNLAVLYYSTAKEWNDKLNALPMKDPKTKEYEAKSNEYFKKAIGYFEASYEVSKDKQTKQILRQICLRLGETEKAEKYK